jgi:hypothetical protein
MANTGEKGKQMAEALLDFVNGASMKDKEAFVQQMLRGHRTLQQEAFNLMIDTCKAWSALDGTELYDDRNNYAVQTSVKIMKATGEWINK